MTDKKIIKVKAKVGTMSLAEVELRTTNVNFGLDDIVEIKWDEKWIEVYVDNARDGILFLSMK